MSIYDFTVLDAEKKSVSLADYKDKVLLVVNTATECGFTPQYMGLQKLQEEFEDRGFEVLDFPCNQFGGQAPSESGEIKNFCQGKFGVTFRTFDKIDVNGKNAAPLFSYLKKNAKVSQEEEEGLKSLLSKVKYGILGDGIKWNFTKFLINRQGQVVGRFSPTTTPESIRDYILKYL